MIDDALFDYRPLRLPLFFARDLWSGETGFGFWDESGAYHSQVFPTPGHAKAALACYRLEAPDAP